MSEHVLKENVYQTFKQMERLDKALRFAAGLISTYPPYDNSHPQDVYDWILREVDADEQR